MKDKMKKSMLNEIVVMLAHEKDEENVKILRFCTSIVQKNTNIPYSWKPKK